MIRIIKSLSRWLVAYRVELRIVLKFLWLCGWVIGLSLLLDMAFFTASWLRYGFVCFLIFVFGVMLLLSIYKDIKKLGAVIPPE